MLSPGVRGSHGSQVGWRAEGEAAAPRTSGAKLGLALVSLPLSSHGLLKMMGKKSGTNKVLEAEWRVTATPSLCPELLLQG